MKRIKLIWFLLLSTAVFSQKNFEGIITYKGTTTNVIDNFEIKMFYSDGKVKIKTIAAPIIEKAYSEIYDFKKGVHYTILEDEKKYLVDSLDQLSVDFDNSELKDTSLTAYILGYYCKSYVEVQKENFSDGSSTIFWFSDSIKSIIPEKYWNKGQVQTADGNMIFLKMQTKMVLSDENDNDKPEIDIFMIVAHKIEKIKIDESEFLPPADYSFSSYKRSISRDSVRVTELTLTELKQEEVIKPPPPPPPPKEPKPLKSPAKKTKQTKPVKG